MMATNIGITVRDFQRAAFQYFSRDEFRLMCRLMVLTVNGSKTCVYTNKQAEKDLQLSSSTATRLFQALEQKGFLSTCLQNTSYGKNTRVVSLNVLNILALIQGEASPATPAMPCAQGLAAMPAEAAVPVPAKQPEPVSVPTLPPMTSVASAPAPAPASVLNKAQRAAITRAYTSPALSEIYKFDFTARMESLGLLPLIVAGREVTPVFDFTELAEELSPSTVRNVDFAYGWPEFCNKWAASFFLFSVVNELCYHQDEMFALAHTCPKYNTQELEDFIKLRQQGLLFFVLGTRDEYDVESFPNPTNHNLPNIKLYYTSRMLIQRIVGRYNPAKSKSDSPLPYLKKVIVSQCKDVLANERDFCWALKLFMKEVRSNAQSQRWAYRMGLVYGDDHDYDQQLALYYPTYWYNGRHPWYDLIFKSADGGETQFPMRLSYPFMLFRKLGGLDNVAAYTRGDTAGGDRITRKVNYDLGHCSAVKASFNAFVQRYSTAYPFLHKLAELGFESV